MRYLLFFPFLLLICWTACTGKSSLPANVLPADKMEAVLWDLLRAEQFTANYVVGRDSSRAAKAKGPQLYAAILKQHGLTDSLFRISLAYYKNHPKQLQPILESIGKEPELAPTPLATAPSTGKTDSMVAPVPLNSTTDPTTPSTNRPNFSPKPLAY